MLAQAAVFLNSFRVTLFLSLSRDIENADLGIRQCSQLTQANLKVGHYHPSYIIFNSLFTVIWLLGGIW
jgi:hypothetical protein